MNVSELVRDIAQPTANEIEIARLPEWAGMMAVLLNGKTSFEFPLVHDPRDGFRLGEQKQMAVVRHEDVPKQKNIHGFADTVHMIEKKVHFEGSQARDAIREICCDKEIAVGLGDAAQPGHNERRIVTVGN